MSEERKPVWWKCPQCGLIVQCMDTVPKDGDDWPAGRACSRCLCGEMVLLWPGTPVQPDASRQLLTDEERDAVEVAARFMDKWGGVPNTIASDTLRGLLERLT